MNINLGNAAGGALAGGAGKAAKGGCGSIFGVLIGLLLVPLGFYLVYYGEVKLVNHGKVFDGLEMVAPEQAKAAEGLVKTSGAADGDFLNTEYWDGPALYVRESTEEYKEEKDDEGKVEYEWKSVGSESEWGSFSVGGIPLKPKGANPVGEEEIWKGYKARGMNSFTQGGGSSGSAQVGDQRLSVDVLDARKNVIVVGEMASDGISGGSTFVISTLAETATSQALHTEYKVSYWLMKGGAVFAIAIGILMIFGPLLTIVGYIPLIGERISGVFVFGAFFFAIVAVGITTLLIKLFWVLLILAIAGIALLIWKGFSSPRTKPGAVAMPAAGAVATPMATPAQPAPQPAPRPAPAPTVQPTASGAMETGPDYDADGDLICPNCQDKITDADNFCMNCGAKLDQGRLIK